MFINVLPTCMHICVPCVRNTKKAKRGHQVSCSWSLDSFELLYGFWALNTGLVQECKSNQSLLTEQALQS